MRLTIPGVVLALLLTAAPALAQEPASPVATPGELSAATPVASPGATPLAAPVTLVPFTSEAFGVAGVAPEGWLEVAPGVRARQADPLDPTLAVVQSVPLSPDAVLTMLLPQLLLDEPPPPTGEHVSDALTWTLYQADVETQVGVVHVDFAISPALDGGMSYVVLVQSRPEDAGAYYQSVFLPMLDQLVPLTAAASPVAYVVEDVTFTNGDVTLAGTLTLPPGPGPHPAVVLVSGSGPQDRDEYLGGGIGIRPFRLLADALTSHGIAVLRYDDRGVGRSTGDFSAATLTDLAGDANAGVAYLLSRPEIDPAQVGLLGHSEGGYIGAYLGARNRDLDFIIALAGPGVSGREVALLQNELILRSGGASETSIDQQIALLEAATAPTVDRAALRDLAYQATLDSVAELPAADRARITDPEQYAQESADAAVESLLSPGLQSLLRYDPAPDWTKTTAPVLAIFGGKDLQVDAEQNAGRLAEAARAGGNADVTVVTVPNANHLFQTADTGNPNEYADLASEFDPELIPTILAWLDDHVTPAAE